MAAISVETVALLQVLRIRHVVHGKTKNAVSHNPLWVGVVAFRSGAEVVEIEHVENGEEHTEFELEVVIVVVANWADSKHCVDEEGAVVAGCEAAEDEEADGGGLSRIRHRVLCIAAELDAVVVAMLMR